MDAVERFYKNFPQVDREYKQKHLVKIIKRLWVY